MADISTTNKKARVPILGENGRISDAYLPQAVIDAEASSKTYAENAKSYSELVKKDAESAASSAASAKASADAAREGISSIDEKVTQAGQFAESASSSATEANNYLEQVTAVSGTVSGIASSVAENANTAETFANKSKESAASAINASTNAVNAKVDAEGYRDSAKSYSDNAKADADTAKNILESVRAQKADVDSTVQQFNTDATEYDTKFNGYVSEAKESKESSATSATSASESAENASTSATNASASATSANASADAAALSATNAANSAKEAADNLLLLGASTLTRKEKDTFVHVDDAFPTKLLGIEIEGATEQATTAGKNLFDYYKLAEIRSTNYVIENGNLKVVVTDNVAWSEVPVLTTLDAGTYSVSADTNVEIRSASNNSILSIVSGRKGNFVLDQATDLKLKVGFGLSSYPAIVKVQIEKGSTATAYEPYTGGKPSQSPEYPQEIKVVENPVVKVTGRNLLDPEQVAASAPDFYSASGGILTVLRTDYRGWVEINPSVALSAGTYCAYGDYLEIHDELNNALINGSGSFTLASDSVLKVKIGSNAQAYPYVSKAQIERGSTSSDYAPYAGTSQAFTLPAEHPYLAKLPDGTADEIIVDKDGNVSLIANVGHMTLAEFGATANIECTDIYEQAIAAGLISGFRTYSVEKPDNRETICTFLPPLKDIWNAVKLGTHYVSGLIIHLPWSEIGITADDSFDTRIDKFKAYAANKTDVHIYYALGDSTKKTYPLGKINLPALPEYVSNVWTDAEVVPITGIEYVRDANIVVSNLEEAIASIAQG